ncbi:enolase C-terminal domain-like protein [Roseomonas sp. CAU 1739]|uniref:enolase C-terminal domain-like protein n=1 Tax=Roseomonas sp. CAU 1739 TaxID=3140364 RepID=UPI00325BC191
MTGPGTHAASRIDRVELHEFTYQVDGFGRDPHGALCCKPGGVEKVSAFCLVITTADGLRGEYCPMHSGKNPAIASQVAALAPRLIGQDAFAREGIWHALRWSQRHLGAIGLSAIDVCLWDLAGKAVGQPIARMLGGFRSRLPTYASTTHADRNGVLSSKEAFGDFAVQCRDLGYVGFKIHGWGEGDPREEAANVLHVRRAVGDGMALMIDPACTLRSFADALHVGRACEEAGYFWYEDPFQDMGTAPTAHRRLRELIRVPLLLTEHVRTLEAKVAWITEGATDFLRADPEYDGGITGTMKTAHLAEAFGLDLELHGAGPAQRHAMAAIRNTNFYELSLVAPGVRNPIPDIFACGYADEIGAVGADGCFPVPDGPGLGVTYDWEKITRMTTQRRSWPA